jgi:S1-C subfamily serine protease
MMHLPDQQNPDATPGSAYLPPTPQRPQDPVRVVDRRRAWWVPFVVLALVIGMVSGALSAVAVSNLLDRDAAASTGTTTTGGGTTVSNVHLDENSAVISAVQKVSPAVVTIQIRSNLGSGGSGSGFIFNANGWILTNRHVVEGAQQIQVILADTRTFTGKVYGIDTLTDLAIVKIDATGLPTAPLGTSADLEQGQVAIAIGNPLGTFQNTVTTGVVSGLGRQITAGDVSQTSSEQLNNLIQTDAAINPGNSGGPLVNSAGQVIGVNTAVNQSAQGIGFAIPIDAAKGIMDEAIAGKPLARPWIGVYYQPVTKGLAQQDNLSIDHGALVGPPSNGSTWVLSGTPAAAAGLKDGDIITAVDGQTVDEAHDLSSLIVTHAPGDTVKLTVKRGSSTVTLSLTLGTMPAQSGG